METDRLFRTVAATVLVIAISQHHCGLAQSNNTHSAARSDAAQGRLVLVHLQTVDGQGATMQETQQWLKQNLEDYGGGCYNQFFDTKISNVDIDSACNLTYTNTMVPREHDLKPRRGQAFIPLGAVTAVELGTLSGGECGERQVLTLRTGNLALVRDPEKSGITLDWLGIKIGNEPSPVPGSPMPQSVTQMAPRIQKALQHAVDLCRGTFKAPQQSKEPF